MKLSLGKRILMFLHWLLSLLIVAAFAVYLIAPDFLTKYYDMLVEAVGFTYVKVAGIALLAIYVLMAALVVCFIFKRKKREERGFITVDSSDSSKVRIAISAIEQMVRQSVGSIDGITDMRIGIENQDDAIDIGVNASIVNGSHVPTITMNMQRAIRQFVETNCGVAVRTVSISIHSVTNQADAPRRRRRGKGQEPVLPATPAIQPERYEPAQEKPVEPVTPIYAPAEPAPAYEAPVEAPAPAYEAPGSAEPEPAPEAAAPAYDFDKPYESEFAKDLAAMKARESAEAYDDGEETTYGEAE